jgi:hypothetical protein
LRNESRTAVRQSDIFDSQSSQSVARIEMLIIGAPCTSKSFANPMLPHTAVTDVDPTCHPATSVLLHHTSPPRLANCPMQQYSKDTSPSPTSHRFGRRMLVPRHMQLCAPACPLACIINCSKLLRGSLAGQRQCALLILSPRNRTLACIPTVEPTQRSLCAPCILRSKRSSVPSIRTSASRLVPLFACS